MRSFSTHLAAALLTAGFTLTSLGMNRPAGEPRDEDAPKENAAPVPPPQLKVEVSSEEETNIRVYEQANRGVVNITTRSVQVDDFLMQARPREGTGSGAILDAKGHIVTNHHVVEEARQVTVTLFDGSTHEAKVVGTDPNNDLAVIRIDVEANRLHPIPWGDSNKLLVGMRVLAIGNPFGLERTLTTGIVSSLNRSLRTENSRLIRGVIQTDAAINPGNSGGPLLNRKGEIIGINTAIISRTGQSSGIGLAVPAATAHRVVEELIKHGRIIRADCGIFSVVQLENGLLIARLIPDGPAEKAGLRGPQVVQVQRGGFVYRTLDRSRADVIVSCDGKPMRTLDDLLSHVESKKPGDVVKFSIRRQGKAMTVEVTLAETRDGI